MRRLWLRAALWMGGMTCHFLRPYARASQLSGCRSHTALQLLSCQVSKALGGCFDQLTSLCTEASAILRTCMPGGSAQAACPIWPLIE